MEEKDGGTSRTVRKKDPQMLKKKKREQAKGQMIQQLLSIASGSDWSPLDYSWSVWSIGG